MREAETDKETESEPRCGGGGCKRNAVESVDERESKEMGICQVLESMSVKGESGAEENLS